ncbi:MAG: AroM family protein [Tepidanaerobacter acetatoxydans]|uniref:AroM family protein n=1 Tax=Tepidanaerobacter acetatoxydans TaxID=499229 RepID=UPI0026EA6EB0|nr:AroM family protein [Tepidanaerobacter acetatoxydans]NLU09502.1 AroM family protein [Tepidanaerobacter acetatoxydans]
MKKIGLVTIGQAPRTDLTPELKMILGEDVQIEEKGALDDLSLEQVRSLYPKPEEEVLVTRMADGTEVKIAGEKVFPLLKEKIKDLEKNKINVIFLACTGEFPDLDTKALLIRPQKLLYHTIKAIAQDRTLGVVIPSKDQVPSTYERWQNAVDKVVVEACSPYGNIDNINTVADKLAQSKVDVIVMDCIGYTMKMKEMVYDKTKIPVVLARSISAKIISELL